MGNWHQQSVEKLTEILDTNLTTGLSSKKAKSKLLKIGFNQLNEAKKLHPWQLFFSQFLDFMVLVLIGAALVSWYLGETIDAIAIIAIVLLNALLGFVQEFRAEKSLEALKELTAPTANLLRDGMVQKIPAREVVPGDVLVLESGDKVAADARLFETVALELNEAVLTGESFAVSKNEKIVTGTASALGERKNMVYAGTIVAGGRGKALVTNTGMETEIGKIAGMIANSEGEETPLQKKLEELGRILILFCLAICAAVATIGILQGEPPRKMFLAAVSLAVAAIPEGLPAIVTIALALGVQRMIKRRAIVRKLQAVETLGCATVICSDKTGTLTQNKLAVTKLWLTEGEYGASQLGSKPITRATLWLLEMAALCNNAALPEKKAPHLEETPEGTGDPTEVALLVAAARVLDSKKLGKKFQRLQEIPFTSERKRMGVWVADDQQQHFLIVKGAAEVICPRVTQIYATNGNRPFDQSAWSLVKKQLVNWGREGLRILAVAYRPADRSEISKASVVDLEKELVLVGLIGMSDPIRPESVAAIRKAHQAGIRVKMITGDYPETARAIAKELGLTTADNPVLNGDELDRLTETEFRQKIKQTDVFARVNPVHKLRIVKLLREKGEVVAMTGDGVNDAPAIKEADIGVAMGQSGTDVTKEASAMIIADDNFATIVAAIEEGRTIYDNIRKFIRYLLSCNTGEILTMFGGLLLGLPLPLLPIQILWVNLVTDGLPAIALGLEAPAKTIMKRSPRSPEEGIFSRGLGLKIIIQGFLIGLATLGVYMIKLKSGSSLATAQTATFATLVFAQLAFVFQCRFEGRCEEKKHFFGNKYLVSAVGFSLLMQIMVMTIPSLQKIFYTTNLNWQDWLLIIGMAVACTSSFDLLWRLKNYFQKHKSSIICPE